MLCSTCKWLPLSCAAHGSDFLVRMPLVETYVPVADAFQYSYRVECPLTAASSNHGLDNLVEEEHVVGLVSRN